MAGSFETPPAPDCTCVMTEASQANCAVHGTDDARYFISPATSLIPFRTRRGLNGGNDPSPEYVAHCFATDTRPEES